MELPVNEHDYDEDPFDPDWQPPLETPSVDLDEGPEEDHGGVGDRWVIGPPGTGKTTFLARQVNFDVKRRGSDAVVVCSHTKAAAAEIGARQLPVDPDQVGTLHSIAYRAMDRPKLLETSDGMKAFSEEHPRYEMSANYSLEDKEAGVGSKCVGDNYLMDYSRLRNLEAPREFWPVEVQAFAAVWEDFKREEEGIDFTDMIKHAVDNTDLPFSDTEVLIVDEAQDLSRLQFKLVMRWAENVDKVVMAHDPDQSIYGFAGADPSVFLEREPRELKVLEQSWRVPRAVHATAMGWIEQAHRRRQVTYLPRDADGEVSETRSTWRSPTRLVDEVEEELSAGEGTIMVLAACGYMLAPTIAELRRRGVPFHNPYRRRNGAWNPFGPQRPTSTTARVMAFLKPFSEGATDSWSMRDVRLWVEIVVKCWQRGAKKKLRDSELLPDDMDEMAVLSEVVAAMKSDEDREGVTNPDRASEWLREHLASARRNVGEYAVDAMTVWGRQEVTSPRLTIGTIHSVKGVEADSVYLYPDLSFQGAAEWNGSPEGSDAVRRQFYVGMTRARSRLTFAQPCGHAIGGYR